MLNGYRIIDSDGHVMEPPGLWEQRLPSELRDRMPQRLGGRWHYQGQAVTPPFPQQVQERFDRNRATHYKEYMEAGWSPASQVKAMDRMGVDISFLYPTRGLILFGFDRMEPRLAAAIARAYNDWLHDFCQHDPKRLKPVAGLSLNDPEEAVVELRRVVDTFGMKAIFVRPNPLDGRLLSDPAYEPLWAECEAEGVAVGIHEGSNAPVARAGDDRFRSHFSRHACAHPMEQMMAFLTLLEGGVLERHPSLRFAFLESGCGWLPYWLWRLDEIEYKNVGFEIEANVKMKPSDYFRRQCYIAAEPEPYLGDLVKHIGEDRILFGSDYPHPDHGPDITDDLVKLEGLVSRPVLQKLLWDNPKRFYDQS